MIEFIIDKFMNIAYLRVGHHVVVLFVVGLRVVVRFVLGGLHAAVLNEVGGLHAAVLNEVGGLQAVVGGLQAVVLIVVDLCIEQGYFKNVDN